MKFLALLGIISLQLPAKSQLISSSVINSTGNSYSQGLYRFEWSVGELAVVQPMRAENGLLVLTNGFLQPNLPWFIPVLTFTDDEIKISPNPTYNKIEIKLQTIQQGMVTISLYSPGGQLLHSVKKVCSGVPDREQVDLSSFTAGTYVVKVELDPKAGSLPKTGSYKIVKL